LPWAAGGSDLSIPWSKLVWCFVKAIKHLGASYLF
jgi:hypothetical protein